jgi:hypothetical protein
MTAAELRSAICAERHPRAPRWLYLAVDDDGIYKVGSTRYPVNERLKQLGWAKAYGARLVLAVASFEGAAAESHLHGILSRYAVDKRRPEWYRFPEGALPLVCALLVVRAVDSPEATVILTGDGHASALPSVSSSPPLLAPQQTA